MVNSSHESRAIIGACALPGVGRPVRHPFAAGLALLLLAAAGCAGPLDRRAFDDWRQMDRHLYDGGHADLRAAAMRHDHRDHPPAPADDLPPGATLDDHVRYALRHNPGLEAAFYRWRAAIERVPQVRALPDPQASFAIVLDEVDRDVDYMGERYALSQMFPWFGKLRLRGDVAMEEAHAEAQRYEAARLELVEQVTEAFVEYAYLHQAAAIARENRELLVRLESVARALFRVGTVSQADVNRAQVELGRLDDQVRSLEDMLSAAAAGLNAALGRPAHAPLPTQPVAPSQQALPLLPERSDEQWLRLARQGNPQLAAMRHEAAGRREAIALAKKEAYPDVMVGVEYARDGSARMAMMDRGGTDMLMGMVSINLPIWRGKLDAARREAYARFGQATRQLDQQHHRLEADLKRALFDHRDSQRKLALYGGTLLPKARQSLATAEAAYRAGDAGFSDLIDAQRVLLEFALAHEQAAAGRARAAARIVTLAGGTHADDDDPATTPADSDVAMPASPAAPTPSSEHEMRSPQ